MEPPHAPLPTARNLPFQPAAGSQTSDLMSESLVGLIVSATRQKAGRLAAACAAPGPPPGCMNLPAATNVAELTVVFGSFSEAASCSHLAPETDCARASTEKPSIKTPTTAITVLIVILPGRSRPATWAVTSPTAHHILR